jgi:hypothetical protein
MDMSLEAALAQFEARIAEAQRATRELGAALQKLQAAAKTGHLTNLTRYVRQLDAHINKATDTARHLASHWQFDAHGYLAKEYREELIQAANNKGLTLVARDQRLTFFPHLLEIDPKALRLRIDKKIEQRLRPAEVVRQLQAMRHRAPTRAETFLKLLYRAYQALTDRGGAAQASNPLVPVVELYSLMTLCPGAEYSIEEFGRDLLLLKRQADEIAQGGVRIEFEHNTVARERLKRIKAYDEEGRLHTFVAVRFVRGG